MKAVDDNGRSICWDAIFKANRYYSDYVRTDPTFEQRYKWMLDTWGVDHGTQHIRIVDEQKYTMLLLRWA